MQDRQLSEQGALFDSSQGMPSRTLPTDDDAGLLALEGQFNSLVAEINAAQKASNAAIPPDCRPPSRGNVEAGFEPNTDREDRTRRTEAVLARLYPIEQAIMATPARTITGLGVKARHAAYVMSHYWEAPIDQIDWDARAMRLLIEAVCGLANVPLPSCEAAAGSHPNIAEAPRT
jgi:hypothetical protein